MSVSVTLRHLWLTRAENLRDALVLPVQAGSTEGWPNLDTVEEWAAGRYRANGRDGLSREWTPNLMLLTLEQRAQLQLRAGHVHWARDPWGGRIACTWASPLTTYEGWVEGRHQQMASVALTLKEITHREVDDAPPYFIAPGT